MTAVDAARDAYDRLSSNGSPIDTAIDDKKVHKDLKVAAENLRDASDRLRGKKESHTFARLLLIAFAGAILALVLSEDLRKGLLDKVFGAEEEFEYNAARGGAGSGARGELGLAPLVQRPWVRRNGASSAPSPRRVAPPRDTRLGSRRRIVSGCVSTSIGPPSARKATS